MYFINNGGLQDDDLGLVTDPLKLKIRMNADDSGESSPSTSMATLSGELTWCALERPARMAR